MGILDEYRKQLEIDKQNENNDFPEGTHLKEEQREEYENVLKGLKNNEFDMEQAYQRKKSEMRQLKEEEMLENKLITDENVEKIVIKHAFCEDCGEELISNAPPMFNPFTFEKVCKHTCTKCGKIYNLEFAYPRLAFYNKDNKEIIAFTR